MICPVCGNTIPDNAKRCPFCRSVIEAQQATPVPVAPVIEEEVEVPSSTLFEEPEHTEEFDDALLTPFRTPEEEAVETEEADSDDEEEQSGRFKKRKKKKKKAKEETDEDIARKLDEVNGKGYTKEAYAPVLPKTQEVLPESLFEKILKGTAILFAVVAIVLVAIYFI